MADWQQSGFDDQTGNSLQGHRVTLLPLVQRGRSVYRLSSVSMATQGVRGQRVCQQLMLFPAVRQLSADGYQDQPIPAHLAS